MPICPSVLWQRERERRAERERDEQREAHVWRRDESRVSSLHQPVGAAAGRGDRGGAGGG